jgi:hypothetical protein
MLSYKAEIDPRNTGHLRLPEEVYQADCPNFTLEILAILSLAGGSPPGYTLNRR